MTVSGTMSRSERSVKSHQQINTLIPYLEEAEKKEGSPNILCDITNFDGIEIKTACRDFHRCVLVGAGK